LRKGGQVTVIWLGERRGLLTDWVTQQWVRATGKRISLADHPWLDGPVGNTRVIGKQFFTRYAEQHGLEVREGDHQGLLENFSDLSEIGTDLSNVSSAVKHFYERTSQYELDAWSEWHGLFRPFGRALAVLFSRRLQQLNIPLSPLDSSKGMSSSVLQLRDPRSGKLVQAAWIRELHATRNVLYAGSYSICTIPGHPSPCVKVVFPLPNGNAIVLMRPDVHPDGSFSVTSAGRAFGDPGFYFVVHGTVGTAWARYLPSLQESIHVYPAEAGTVRADHPLWLWGKEFLRLHYRMRGMEPTSMPTQASDRDISPTCP
jgi:hypothetical protein